MADPFLICHKVRGQPAFDVAIQMDCPHCQEWQDANCHECDSLGYWWIVSTSGHRAYPYWHSALLPTMLYGPTGEMPPTLRDHYETRAAPNVSLVDALGLRKPKADAPTTPIARRF